MSRRPGGSVTLPPTVPRDLAELYATHAAPLARARRRQDRRGN